ncbi:MAG: dienelactone hydrolase family protein [Candidatus Sumerlaeota bacterium]|nr:dienelactone hydrolase family protein [Candidatus Sumerlaeota bacterium]
MKRASRGAALTAAWVWLAVSVHAATVEPPAAPARRLASPPNLDGVIEPTAWGATPTFSFLSDLYRPLPAQHRTQLWLAYDDANLWLAWSCDEPGLNLEPLTKEKDSPAILAESCVEARLLLPASGKEAAQTALFAVNPHNARYDSLENNPEWNVDWASAAAAGKDAWSVEMKIPFASLKAAKPEERKDLRAAFIRRVRGGRFETEGWPIQAFDAEDQPLAALAFPEKLSIPIAEPARRFWSTWPARFAEAQTSSTLCQQALSAEDCPHTKRMLDLALERAATVDASWGLSDGAHEAALRAILTDLEERIQVWLADLRQAAATPSVPDRILPLELPAPSGLGQARSVLLLCGQTRPQEPTPLVVNLHPSEENYEAYSERFMKWRDYGGQPFLLLAPEGGGAQTRHDYDGEQEALDAIDAVRALFPVDDDRVYLLGYSMGGAAVERLATRMPGRFAAAAAIAAGGPVDFIENLGHLPVFLYHGAEDATTPVSASRDWDRRRAEVKAPGDLTVYEKAGHDILDQVVNSPLWEKLFAVRRQAQPDQVHFRVPSLRYNKAYWVRVDRLTEYPPDAVVDFRLASRTRIEGTTKGVGAVAIELAPSKVSPDQNLALVVNGVTYYEGPYRPEILAELAPPPPGALRKTPALGGPLDEAYRGPALYIWGTQDSDKWTEALRAAAQSAARRPGFRPERPTAADTSVTRERLGSANLFLFGGPEQNRVVADLKERLPVSLGSKGAQVGGQTFAQPDQIAQFLWPSPYGEGRYVVLHWARSPEAMRSAPWFLDPFRFHLLPDGVIDTIAMTSGGLMIRKRAFDWWFGEDWTTVKVVAGQAE